MNSSRAVTYVMVAMCAISSAVIRAQVSGVVSGSIQGGASMIPGTSGVAAGAISGVIVDDRGAPVARATVQAMGEAVMPNGARVQVGRSSMPTDANGRFRIDGLPPQSYLVAAMPPFGRPSGIYGAAPSDDQPVSGVTYFPGVIDQKQAQAVKVTANGDQAIFIELQRVQPIHVRGTVSSPSGRSTAGLQIQLQQKFGNSSSSRGVGFVQNDGTFDIAGITPGHYALVVRVAPAVAASEFAAVEIDATDRDIDGLALALGIGGSINGRIVFDGPNPGSAPLGATVSVGPTPGGSFFGPFAAAPVADDWTFQVRGLFGSYRFGLPMILMRQYRPARFEFDGHDIGSGGVEIRDGEHQLVIHLTPITSR